MVSSALPLRVVNEPALSLGIVATSRKPAERRLPIHPAHFDRLDPELRGRIFLERGYGERFGVTDATLASHVGGLRSRRELLDECDVVVLAKPVPEDLEERRPGTVLWGWPHCVQDHALTQLAIDRRLTLIAWEAMNYWTDEQHYSLHVFHKNNEIAGYCAVLHALQLVGCTGAYGRRLRAAVISFGATARGAVTALFALGVHDVTVLTHRSVPAVAAPIAPARLVHYEPDPQRPSRPLALNGSRRTPVAEFLAGHDIVVNCILQDTDHPLVFVHDVELGAFAPGSLIIDVSCDTGMGFEWARPTSFAEPMLTVGRRRALLRRRPQPFVPLGLGDMGDQRGADPVRGHRHGRRRRLGRRPDDPPRDRDPQRRGAEPEDPLLPVTRPCIPARGVMTAGRRDRPFQMDAHRRQRLRPAANAMF